jgi:hypothetical protein
MNTFDRFFALCYAWLFLAASGFLVGLPVLVYMYSSPLQALLIGAISTPIGCMALAASVKELRSAWTGRW